MSIRQGIAILCGVGATYAWFLLFAQFAFLEIVRNSIGDGPWLKAIMGAMAAGGIATGFLVALRARQLRKWLACSFATSAAVSAVAMEVDGRYGLLGIAFAIGASLAVVTVAMAGVLGGVREKTQACYWVGAGTGVGYAWCNMPFVFQAPPVIQAGLSSVVALIGLLSVAALPDEEEPSGRKTIAWQVLAAFAALVWMDSVAFYIIQHTEELKRVTWDGSMLVRNALIHLVVAIVAGCWLGKRGCRVVLMSAWVLIALAAWWAQESQMRSWAGWCYPAGVSLYSAALTSWPGLLAARGKGDVRSPSLWRAAWLFGVAGWGASGLGIVMADGKQKIPLAWLTIAGGILLVSLVKRSSPLSSRPPDG